MLSEWLETELGLGSQNFVNKGQHTVADGGQRGAMLVISFPLGPNKPQYLDMHNA